MLKTKLLIIITKFSADSVAATFHYTSFSPCFFEMFLLRNIPKRTLSTYPGTSEFWYHTNIILQERWGGHNDTHSHDISIWYQNPHTDVLAAMHLLQYLTLWFTRNLWSVLCLNALDLMHPCQYVCPIHRKLLVYTSALASCLATNTNAAMTRRYFYAESCCPRVCSYAEMCFSGCSVCIALDIRCPDLRVCTWKLKAT